MRSTIIQIRKEFVLTGLLRNMITRYARMIVKFCEFDIHKEKHTDFSVCFLCVGTFLFSRAAARQVSSAQVSLTSVFGMGTGGPSPQSAPTYSVVTLNHTLKTEQREC